jgi:hypothetical protein
MRHPFSLRTIRDIALFATATALVGVAAALTTSQPAAPATVVPTPAQVQQAAHPDCKVTATRTVPSGTLLTLYVPQVHGDQTFTCQDGTLVYLVPCTIRDWGNTTQIAGVWSICQPADGTYVWQPMPAGRHMAS